MTDHAEYEGIASLPNSGISKLPIAENLKVRRKEDIQRVYLFLGTSLIKNQVTVKCLATRWFPQ